MATTTTPSAIEMPMARLIPGATQRAQPYTSAEILSVQRLLEGGNRPSWAARPRVYIILRLLGCLDLMQGFVAEALWDSDLPIEETRLPEELRQDESLRDGFLRKQNLVLDIPPPGYSASEMDGANRVTGNMAPDGRNSGSISSGLARNTSMGPAANGDEGEPSTFTSPSRQDPRTESTTRSTSVNNNPDVGRTASTQDKIPLDSLTGSNGLLHPDTSHEKIPTQSLGESDKIHHPDPLFEKIPASTTASTRNSFSSERPNPSLATNTPWYRRPVARFSTDKIPLLRPDRGNLPIPAASRRSSTASTIAPSNGHKKSKSLSRLLAPEPPLLDAVRAANTSLVADLLRNDPIALRFAEHKDGWTALHIAAAGGFVSILRLILPLLARTSVSIDVRTKRQDHTPLALAAAVNHLDSCTLLLSHGADINAVSKMDGATPFHRAALKGHARVCALLLDHYATLPPHQIAGQTPLVNRLDKEGLTPLFWAVQGVPASPETCALLVGRGADLEHRAVTSRATVLQRVVFGGNIPTARLLLECGADVNADGVLGMRCVHKAASDGNLAMLRLLITGFRPELETRTERGWTPLHLAARWGHIRVCEWLVSPAVGANAHAVTDLGKTPGRVAHEEGFDMGLPLISNEVPLTPDKTSRRDFSGRRGRSGHAGAATAAGAIAGATAGATAGAAGGGGGGGGC